MIDENGEVDIVKEKNYPEYPQIWFELDTSKRVKIMASTSSGVFHMIGRIETPSANSDKHPMTMQVCGFSEAFETWGCGIFGRPVKVNLPPQPPITFGEIERIDYIQQKDIQLIFNPDTVMHQTEHGSISGNDCLRCYNWPCTCESKIGRNLPYTVKRATGIFSEKKPEQPNEKKILGKGIEMLGDLEQGGKHA